MTDVDVLEAGSSACAEPRAEWGVERDAVVAAPRASVRTLLGAATIARLLVEAQLQAASPTRYAERARRTAGRILSAHGIDVRCPDPVPVGPVLIVANHVSYLDPMVIASLAPCLAIAKSEAEAWPLIGAGMRALGVLFVRRGDVHSGAVVLRRALRGLLSGASVLNFPEGTTTDGRAVGAFRRCAFGLARLAGVPVVPARIAYDDARAAWFGGQTFVPHYGRLVRIPRIVAQVRFGQALRARPSEDARDLAARAHRIVSTLSG